MRLHSSLFMVGSVKYIVVVYDLLVDILCMYLCKTKVQQQ